MCGESLYNLEQVFGRKHYEHLAQKDFRISTCVDRDFSICGTDCSFGFRNSNTCCAAREAESSPTPSRTAPSSLINNFEYFRAVGESPFDDS
jgi:hypothetical protein